MRRTLLRLGLALAVGGATIAAGLGSSAAQSSPLQAAGPAGAPAAGLAAAAADQAAASGFDALAKGPNETFVRRSAVAGSGGLTYFAYDRTYRGLPVVGGDAVVAVDKAGHVRGTSGARTGALSVPSITYQVKPGRAEAVARAQLTRATDVSDARLVVLATGSPRLAWEVQATGTRNGVPSNLQVYVDARTGKVAAQWDLVRTEAARGFYNGNIDIDTSGGLLQDPIRPGLSCANINTRQIYRNGGTGTGTDLQTACVDAYYAVEQEFDMLGAWLDRNGINGNGRAFPLFVGLNDVNAFWNGSSGSFGHSADNRRQATNIDVVAHEMGHAIFQTTPGGSGGGGNETGGLNESTGDIFGALTEHFANNPNDPPDYQVGEEVNLTGNGPIRIMYNPQLTGDPNCFSGQIPNTEVHAAAGPNNHWFYLTAVGSSGGGGNPSSPTCNGSSVTGIGIQEAGQIYMGALNMKNSGWRYVNVRTATLRAAVNLFGAASQECRTVKAAWDAVSVPAQPGEAQCQTGPTNDFSIRVSPTSGSTAQGGSVSTTVITETTQGNAQQVSLSASGLPGGVTANFSPSTVTSGGNSTLTFSASANATTGTRTVTVTGNGSSGTHTTTYSLTVTGGQGGDDFSLSLNPTSATVQAGGSTQSTVSTATISGSPQTVNLTVSGAPTGVTATVSPSSVTSGGSATLSISTAANTAAGTFQLTVTGTGTSATHAVPFTLVVQGDGGGCGGVAAWDSVTPYEPGDQVSHNGRLWNSTWWSTGAEPGAPQSWAVWSDAGPC